MYVYDLISDVKTILDFIFGVAFGRLFVLWDFLWNSQDTLWILMLLWGMCWMLLDAIASCQSRLTDAALY